MLRLQQLIKTNIKIIPDKVLLHIDVEQLLGVINSSMSDYIVTEATAVVPVISETLEGKYFKLEEVRKKSTVSSGVNLTGSCASTVQLGSVGSECDCSIHRTSVSMPPEQRPPQASRTMTSCKRPSVKTWVTCVVILLVVLVILSVTGVKVYNKINREKNSTDDGIPTLYTSVQVYSVV